MGAPGRDNGTRRTGWGSQRCVLRAIWKGDWLTPLGSHSRPHTEAGALNQGLGSWGRYDLEADPGHIHNASNCDGVDIVEGHAVGILPEEVPVHHHLSR